MAAFARAKKFASALVSFFSCTKFVPIGFSAFLIYCIKFYCIIPIVLQKFSLSMKNAENLDVKELLEGPLYRYVFKPACRQAGV